MRIPKEMGGPGGPFTNPEQLFATGYAACFHSASRSGPVAKVDVSDCAVTARVGIRPNDSGGFELRVGLEAELPGVDGTVAEQLGAKARQVCPYSNATRNNIDVTLTVV